MPYYSPYGNEPQVKQHPPLIDKKLHGFVPRVARKKPMEFRSLIVGSLFRMVSRQVTDIEQQLVLEKVGVSSSKNNARVVQTVRAKENPIGQFWEISALCPVEEVKI